MVNNILKIVEDYSGIEAIIIKDLITTIVVILFLALIRLLVMRLLKRKTKEARMIYLAQKSISYFIYLVGFLIIGRIWFNGFKDIGTFLGLLSAGLAIALKDIVVNLVGWIFILLRRPFTIGDRIQIGEHKGDVVDIRIFQFTIMEVGNWVDAEQSTGRILHIPNGFVFTHPQANYSKGFHYIWNEIGVLITFESNYEKAKEYLLQIAKREGENVIENARRRLIDASEHFMISYSKLDPGVFLTVKDSGIMITLRYLCDPQQRRVSENRVWIEILDLISEEKDLELAYPTMRIYQREKF